jgi:1,4-dihydroxy-2-naphthoyl-CoA hydrolase
MKDQIQAAVKGILPDHLGIVLEDVSKTRVVAALRVRPEVSTNGGRLHGGAIMALADTVGAVGAFLNLPEGATGTTTIESKTNFCAGVWEGIVRATAEPVHIGKRTSCWTTRILDEKGRLVAQVTQTQMVLS